MVSKFILCLYKAYAVRSGKVAVYKAKRGTSLTDRGIIMVDHVFTEYLRANKHETALSFFLLEFNPTDLYNAGFQKYLPRLELN